MGKEVRRNPQRLVACNPEATPYEYLAAIEIKVTAATKRNPKAQYPNRTGAGVFVAASLRLPRWTATRGTVLPGLMHATAWPRTDEARYGGALT